MTAAEWTELDKEQAEALFREHAMLIFDSDVIPIHVANQLFPSEVVRYLRSPSFGGRYYNGGGLNELFPHRMYFYLTRRGFLEAVGLSNALHFCEAFPDAYPQIEPSAPDEKPKRARSKKGAAPA